MREFYLKKDINQVLNSQDDYSKSSNYFKMINEFHTERVSKLLDGQEDKIIYKGGKIDIDNNFVPPIILLNPNLNSMIMTEEIFGPILPIITFE